MAKDRALVPLTNEAVEEDRKEEKASAPRELPLRADEWTARPEIGVESPVNNTALCGSRATGEPRPRRGVGLYFGTTKA